ncbi:hypothetical protein ABK040_014220 [Willaertia magna]
MKREVDFNKLLNDDNYYNEFINNKELKKRNNLNKKNEIILDNENIDEINYLINNNINVIEDSKDNNYIYETNNSEYEEINDLEIIENEYKNNSLILNL